MTPSLADSLRLVLPWLPTALATDETRQTTLALAAKLAPIALGGFECRLDADSQQVDFMQCIQAADGEPGLLRRHLEAGQDDFQNQWLRIRDFCAAWEQPDSPLQASINDLWLEFDMDGRSPGDVPVPSVFMAFKPGAPAEVAREALDTALRLLTGGALPQSVLENLNRCYQACQEMAEVSHIGLMLPRQVEGLRLNLKGLNQETMPAYLVRAGWQAPLHELKEVLGWVFSLVDYVTLCLDVGAQFSPRLGLECGFDQQPDREPAWSDFMTQLAARGLAAAPKCSALLDWAGTETPQSAALPWPEHLIVASLTRSPELCGILGRRLSHIKLDLRPGQPIQAKGYIGFGHIWAKTAMFAPRKASHGDPLEEAISRAAQFLLAARSAGGGWEDFLLAPGPSDEWVTAYVGLALAEVDHPDAQEAGRQAWAWLQGRRAGEPGWGYNGLTPTDADSTGWGLRLARQIGEMNSETARAAHEFLAGHQQPDGGVATYANDEPIRRRMNLPRPAPVGGWLTSHTCVTAAVATMEGLGAGPRAYLRRTQCADGSWRAYWWHDHEYATALAAEALAGDDGAQTARAIQWALGRLRQRGRVTNPTRPGGSAFATAWGLRTLLLAEKREAVNAADRAVKWLLTAQQPDGAWAASARLRQPPPSAMEADSEPGVTLATIDQNRNFTTATVLTALRQFRQWQFSAE